MSALVAGCGHFAFDALPAEPEEGGPGLDGGVDGDPPDSAVADSAVAPCTGPSCPGTYVSGTTGSDTNPGTGLAPVKTIAKAMAIAAALGGKQNVYVASGRYAEKVTLFDQVELLGGYECSVSPCNWARDIAKNETVINATDFEGVLVPNTVTRKTRLEGFRIVGKDGAPNAGRGSAALTIDGGTPIIQHNTIAGGNTTIGTANGFARSIGVLLIGPTNAAEGVLIDGNTITSGQAAEDSFALVIERRLAAADTVRAVAVVTGNTIRSGTAPVTTGIVAWAAGPGTLVQGNDIAGGTSPGGGNNPGSWGITVGGTMTIDNNRINVDQSKVGSCADDNRFCGGIQSQSSTSIVTNNVVLGVKANRSCAVLLAEVEKPAGAVVLNGNTLNGAGVGLATFGFLSTAIAVRLSLSNGTSTIIGNVRNNILIGGANKYRYGVYEDETPGKTSRTAVLDNNLFWNPVIVGAKDYAYHRWNGSGGLDLLFSQLSSVTPTPVANINQDPILDAKFHLEGASPCIDKGTPTEAAPRDMDGESRPKGAGIDIGADEAK